MKSLYGFAMSLFALALASCGGGSLASPPIVGGHTSVQPPATESVLYFFKGAPDAAFPYGGLLVRGHDEFLGISNGGGTTLPSGLAPGAVYEVSSAGQESVLYSFQGGNDGVGSEGGLVADNMGNLFGTTQVGGGSTACTNGCGVVFEMQRNHGIYAERVIYAFAGGSDGAVPLTRLTVASDGVLYGTTAFGGAGSCTGVGGVTGCGTVFSLTPSGSTYTEKIIYRFTGGKDGESPRAGLMLDSKGALYGTTDFGGNTHAACLKDFAGNPSCGVVFKITRGGQKNILYRFNGGATDGANPRAAVLRTTHGRLVGLTVFGGPGCGGTGCGTAYELTPSGNSYTERVIYFFGQTSSDGAHPFDADGLTSDVAGHLYGTTELSTQSPCGCGTVFELTPTPSGYSERVLHFFTAAGSDGALPFASVVLKDHALYGTTYQGGSYCYGSSTSCGSVYKVAL